MDKKVKKSIENIVGLPMKKIISLDLDDEIKYVEDKTQKKLIFPKHQRLSKFSRGNPLLALNRIKTLDDLNKDFFKINVLDWFYK